MSTEDKKQIALFDNKEDSDIPLPLRAAEHFGFPLQHHDEMYSLQDWVRGLVGSKPKQIIADIKRHSPELLDSIRQLPYKATIGAAT